MREKHKAIARYRVYFFEPRKPRGAQRTYLKPFGLHWDDANARRNALNAALDSESKNRFTDPLYGVQLENGWECLSQWAKDRHTLLGKGPKDFDLCDDTSGTIADAPREPADMTTEGAG